MSDLIDRKAILKHIEKIRQGLQMMDGTHRASIVMHGMYLCEAAVRNQPSVQPERKKGKWHQRFYPQIEMMVCSECNNEFSYDAETGVRDYNFCPNCGADMRGEQDDCV